MVWAVRAVNRAGNSLRLRTGASMPGGSKAVERGIRMDDSPKGEHTCNVLALLEMTGELVSVRW